MSVVKSCWWLAMIRWCLISKSWFVIAFVDCRTLSCVIIHKIKRTCINLSNTNKCVLSVYFLVSSKSWWSLVNPINTPRQQQINICLQLSCQNFSPADRAVNEWLFLCFLLLAGARSLSILYPQTWQNNGSQHNGFQRDCEEWSVECCRSSLVRPPRACYVCAV